MPWEKRKLNETLLPKPKKNSSVPFSSIDWTPSIVAMLGLQCILYKFGGLGCFEILLSLTVTKEYRILTMESKKMKRGVYAHEALIKIEYVTKFMEKISTYNLSRRTLHAVRSEGSEKSFRNSRIFVNMWLLGAPK